VRAVNVERKWSKRDELVEFLEKEKES